jgi:hypothetical protein
MLKYPRHFEIRVRNVPNMICIGSLNNHLCSVLPVKHGIQSTKSNSLANRKLFESIPGRIRSITHRHRSWWTCWSGLSRTWWNRPKMSQIGPKDWISRCGSHKCLHWAMFWRKTPGSVWASVSRLHIAWQFSSSRKTFEWGEPAVKRPKVNVSCRIHDKAFRNTLNQPSFQGNSLGVSERPYLVCTLRDGDLDKNFGICCGSCIRNWSNRGARRCLVFGPIDPPNLDHWDRAA